MLPAHRNKWSFGKPGAWEVGYSANAKEQGKISIPMNRGALRTLSQDTPVNI